MKKFLLSVTFLCATLCTFAQNATLQGTWVLKKMHDNSGKLIDIPQIYYKVYHADGTFSNLSFQQNGLKLSHKGTFNVSQQENSYEETIQHSNKEIISSENTTNKLKIVFADEGKTVTIEGTIKLTGGTHQLYEIWTKLD